MFLHISQCDEELQCSPYDDSYTFQGLARGSVAEGTEKSVSLLLDWGDLGLLHSERILGSFHWLGERQGGLTCFSAVPSSMDISRISDSRAWTQLSIVNMGFEGAGAICL